MTCHDCIAELVNRYVAIDGMHRREHPDKLMDEMNKLRDFLGLRKKHCPCGCIDSLAVQTDYAADILVDGDLAGFPVGLSTMQTELAEVMRKKGPPIYEPSRADIGV